MNIDTPAQAHALARKMGDAMDLNSHQVVLVLREGREMILRYAGLLLEQMNEQTERERIAKFQAQFDDGDEE